MPSADRDLIDHSYRVETPEGVELEVELAGVVPRSIAYMIDFAIRIATIVVLSLVFAFLGRFGWGLVLISWFVIEWAYPIVFELSWHGQTPGKRKMGLVVFNDDLTPVNWRASTLRNLLRAADMLPFAYLFGIVAMMVGSNSQRLGDLVAGTLVIYRASGTDQNDFPEAVAQVPEFSLEQPERRALIKFAQRHQHMTPQRAEELAAILTPLTGLQGERNVQYLYGVGNWLSGRYRDVPEEKVP